jgi:hypothetical protein
MDEQIKKLYDKTRELLKKWSVTDEEADEFMKELMEASDKNGDGDVADDIKAAEEDIAEKGPDTQSEKDRVDEAVGDDLKYEKKEDSQTADDRVNESEGEEKKLEEENEEPTDPSVSDMKEVEEPEEKPKEATDAGYGDKFKALEERLGLLEKVVEKMGKSPKPVVDRDEVGKLERLKRQYSN